MNGLQLVMPSSGGLRLTEKERDELGMTPFMPRRVLTVDQEVAQMMRRIRAIPTDMAKYLFLRSLRSRDVALFFEILKAHTEELLPIVYTPTISEPIQAFSHCFDGTAGVYLSIDRVADMPRLMEMVKARYAEIDIVIVTDGEGILGIGDWGVGGSEIVAGKGVVYTVAAHIPTERILTVMLDVGTNNQELLEDPYYLGLQELRATGDVYDAFIESFVAAMLHHYPDALLHWEDFGRDNASRLLQKYQHLFTFNDDIQGTGIIVLAALSAAFKRIQADIRAQRIFIYGAGSAGRGIAMQIKEWLVSEGLTPDEAERSFYYFGADGLISGQRDMAGLSLAEAVTRIQPTVLIGTSTASGAFSEEIVRKMRQYCETPIIFPISNPTTLAEAKPQDLYDWTAGNVLVATGSPFPNVHFAGSEYRIAQANNALAYPGLALGAILGDANTIDTSMLSAAAVAIGDFAATSDALLPSVAQLFEVSLAVAKAVAKTCAEQRGEIFDDNLFQQRLAAYIQ
ncbi:oxaloacetate-decarboxylating malate dehydrogenase [Listeria booriae]|uniref:oxaloacetate-decarboxylating malate dehydrogenase n=1 Tax=Listeria booriae TaxID=1552123 RepID=UPI001625E711|nr:oxaloacetate-decarboxylating malate dehydrogenase [Listeria booriae]MBC1210594.1 oxaloacetate-decarboxylating malate dehydrogenase [Listeria booriae]